MPRSDEDVLLTLFKYRSLADEHGRKAAVDILRHNRMWWQSPVSFNDPFDCCPAVIFGHSKADREAFVRRVTATHSPAGRKERRVRQKELLSIPAQEHERRQRAWFMEAMAESAVTCFSEVSDSILMWGHYADSHRGVCFAFNEQANPQWFAFDVTYSQERPIVDLTNLAGAQLIEKAVLTKSAEWQYEQEHRLFDYRTPAGYRTFPPEALVGVIYGARISESDRAFVDGLVAQRGGLQRWQASVDEKYFKVNIAPLG